jgi:hypothetical protein
MHESRFGLFSGPHQAFHYKNLKKEDKKHKIQSKGPLVYSHCFLMMLKYIITKYKVN